jgi:hypothetical protein
MSVVRTAKMPIRVDAYMTGAFPEAEALSAKIRGLLANVHESNPSAFAYEINPPSATNHEAERIHLVFDGAYGPDPGTFREYRLGLEIRYGPKTIDIGPINLNVPWPTFEFLVSTTIRNVVATVDATRLGAIGVMAQRADLRFDVQNFGHDIASTMARRFEAFYPYYSLQNVDLSHDLAPLPAALVLLQPARQLTDQELRRLDDMVLRGCPLLVFTSAVNVRAGDPSMRVTLDSFGLNRLLRGYGIEIENNALLVRAITVPEDPLLWTGVARSARVDESFPPFRAKARPS